MISILIGIVYLHISINNIRIVLNTLITSFYIMQRDVNLNLIYIILILLLAIGGSVIFYQMKYEKLKSDCESSMSVFNESIKNLSVDQKKLYENITDLNVSASREYMLASKLEKKAKDLENTSIELASVQQQLFECQQISDSLNVNYTFSKTLLDRHAAAISKMQEDLDNLKSDVNRGATKDVLLTDIQQLQDELNKLKSY